LKYSSIDVGLLQVRPRATWKAFRREPWSFWLLCVYLLVEYLRPQMVYPALDVVPWGQLTLGACLVSILLNGWQSRKLVLMDLLIAAFFFWVLLSSVLALRPDVSFGAWQVFAGWFILYYLIPLVVTTPRRTLLFFLFFLLVNLKMSQHGARTWVLRGFAFADWGATGSPGWFQNSGEFAMEMAGVVGISWCLLFALRRHIGKWKFRLGVLILPGTAAASVMASSSRGGQLALVGVVIALLIFHKVRFRNLAIVGAIMAVGWILVPAEQKVRFQEMGEDPSSESRLTYWRAATEVAVAHPLTGIGYNNWPAYWASVLGGGRIERIHNSTLQAAAETGFPGAALFLGMVLLTFRLNAQTRRRAKRMPLWGDAFWGMAAGLDAGMVGFILAGQFMSVLYYPIFWVSFGLTTAVSETSRKAVRATARQPHHPPLLHSTSVVPEPGVG
jgi:putative inorganic carbon (HCO3(-)) transporter